MILQHWGPLPDAARAQRPVRYCRSQSAAVSTNKTTFKIFLCHYRGKKKFKLQAKISPFQKECSQRGASWIQLNSLGVRAKGTFCFGSLNRWYCNWRIVVVKGRTPTERTLALLKTIIAHNFLSMWPNMFHLNIGKFNFC